MALWEGCLLNEMCIVLVIPADYQVYWVVNVQEL